MLKFNSSSNFRSPLIILFLVYCFNIGETKNNVIKPKLVNPLEADVARWPFLVWIQIFIFPHKSWGHFGMGTLVGNQQVLTSRACVVDTYYNDTYPAEYIRIAYDERQKDVKVKKIIIMDWFVLLITESPIPFSDTVSSAAWAIKSPKPGVRGKVVSKNAQYNTEPGTVYEGHVIVMDTDDCREKYKNESVLLPQEFFCVKPVGTYVCVEDEGAPVMVFNNIAGIMLSYFHVRLGDAEDCITSTLPIVAVDVAKYASIIELHGTTVAIKNDTTSTESPREKETIFEQRKGGYENIRCSFLIIYLSVLLLL